MVFWNDPGEYNGLVGANWSTGSKRLKMTNILIYGDNVDLGPSREVGSMPAFETGCQSQWQCTVLNFQSQKDLSPFTGLHFPRHKSISEQSYLWLSQLVLELPRHSSNYPFLLMSKSTTATTECKQTSFWLSLISWNYTRSLEKFRFYHSNTFEVIKACTSGTMTS